ncbi:MAG: DUF808 domain-containing protein [Myxococcales bacterium]|nr:DUF808 domain-containing protein [Myxococcales bacterium]
MASAGLLALLDDLTVILDDVAAMTKIALKKTAGVAGDDLAVGAQQVVGLHPSRELPIVWAVAKGSLLNKSWLVPVALLLSAFAPVVIVPIMMLGGAFLCYEGVHKILHRLFPAKHVPTRQEHAAAAERGAEALVALERRKIKEAVRTDAILSAEIVVIALGSFADKPIGTQVLALVAVALVMTAAIYGLIALIVKVDDLGLHLAERPGTGLGTRVLRGLGTGLVRGMPLFMKLLSVVGTIAMFLVGAGIFVHGVPAVEHALEALVHAATSNGVLQALLEGALVVVGGVGLGLVAVPFAKLAALSARAVARRRRAA